VGEQACSILWLQPVAESISRRYREPSQRGKLAQRRDLVDIASLSEAGNGAMREYSVPGEDRENGTTARPSAQIPLLVPKPTLFGTA
jgi:hypothetical protein